LYEGYNMIVREYYVFGMISFHYLSKSDGLWFDWLGLNYGG